MKAAQQQGRPITQKSAHQNSQRIQHLLTAFENSGLVREEFNLKGYFALHPDTYGDPGDEIRAIVSKRWYKIKLLPIDKYVAYLKVYGVVRGIRTKCLEHIAEQDKPPSSLKKALAKTPNQVAFKVKMAPRR